MFLLTLALSCTENSIHAHEGLDIFQQSPADLVDVLLIVDDSCSMEPYQQELSGHFEAFRGYLDQAEVHWHIGVTTTDAPEHLGQLQDFIRWDEEDSSARFAEAVQVGIEGSGIEMGLEAAQLTLERDTSGFVRPEASFSAIFVSDEEDASPHAVSDYIRTFEALKGLRERDAVSASAIVTLDEASCGNEWSTRGDRYVHAAEFTEGVVGDVCSDDFEPILVELGFSASRLLDTFELSELPNPPTLELELDGEAVPCTEGRWRYELLDQESGSQPAVVFERSAMPAPEQEIVVRYRLGEGDPEDFCP